jgi:hypothetical protein
LPAYSCALFCSLSPLAHAQTVKPASDD